MKDCKTHYADMYETRLGNRKCPFCEISAMQKVVDAARVVFGPNRPVTAIHKNQLALQDALAELDKETKK